MLVFCFRNLFRRKIRSALCILGVALAATFVIAVGGATMRYTTVIKEVNVLFHEQVTIVSNDSIVIQAIPIGGSMLLQGYIEEKIQGIQEAGKAVPILFITPVGMGGISQFVPVNFTMGIPVEDWQLTLRSSWLKGNMGRFPINESSNEVVVGVSLADQYGWTVGTELTINGHSLNVTGVLDTKVALLGRSIIMPLKLAQNVYNYRERVNIITVKPAIGYTQDDLATALRQNLTYVNALTEEERNDIIQPVLAQIETWNRGIETTVFFMSLILVMNVMIMSVSERRRDFATLDAIGAPFTYIVGTVIAEAILIGVLGGALGICFGSMSAVILASVYTSIPLAQFFIGVLDIVPPLFMIEVFVAVVVVCCIGGIIPAINAARMRIAEVLRAEY